MKIFEAEVDVSERLGQFYIPVWENSDKSVANAIRIFREKWHVYSEESKNHNIMNLIKQLIDPVVSEYLSSLPNQYLSFCPISREKCNYSDLIKLRGFVIRPTKFIFFYATLLIRVPIQSKTYCSYRLKICSNHCL